MNGKIIASFFLGIVSGAGAAYLYLKNEYEKKRAYDLQACREHYEQKEKEIKEKYYAANEINKSTLNVDTISEKNEEPTQKDITSKLNYNALYNKEPLVSSEDKVEDKIYLITPEAFYSETFYDKKNLTYYEGDDILCDELTDEILDIENTIGIENIESFGNPLEEPDADPYIMHIRNNKFGCVYEVVKDERSYSAVVERDDE